MIQLKRHQIVWSTLIAMTGCLSQSCWLPSHAVCLSSQVGNNCKTFDPSTSSVVTQTYIDANLVTNPWFQVGFITNNASSFTIDNIGYSYNGNDFTLFSTSSLTVSATKVFTEIINKGSAVGIPFYIRYTIAGLNAVSNGSIVESQLLSNSNGSQSNGSLTNTLNGFVEVNRDSTATPVPLESDALPVVVATAFVGGGMWLKRKQAATSVAALKSTPETQTKSSS